jgi:flavin-binding protein dodecin
LRVRAPPEAGRFFRPAEKRKSCIFLLFVSDSRLRRPLRGPFLLSERRHVSCCPNSCHFLIQGVINMSIAKVTELTASSKKSFEDAIQTGIARAAQTVRNIQSAWVNEQTVVVKDDKVTEWRVNLRITFLLD